MKKYDLGATDLRQYESLTDDEREAWLHPEQHSYHSLHIERMGADTFHWRDSREGKFCIGTSGELLEYILELRLRKLDPDYLNHVTTLRILSQSEIDDLLADL